MDDDEIYSKIIDEIYINRISTTEVADCLGKKGVLPQVFPLNQHKFSVGRVMLVYAYNESNYELHQQLEKVELDTIVLVETYNVNERAVFGDLVSKFLCLYKRVAGIVVNGYMRDTHKLLKNDYPIWCKGSTPIGCFNIQNTHEMDSKTLKKWSDYYSGSIAVCDDSGVVIIPKSEINLEFLEKLDHIEKQEDIWYYCVDQKKWSTYETVCLKKYMSDENIRKL